MGRVALGAILTLAALLFRPPAARAQDIAPITSVRDGGTLGPLVAIAAIDSDSRAEVVKQLELRGYDPAGASLDRSLRAFAEDHGLESPDDAGWVAARTLDELGAGRAIALRWTGSGPRAPELSSEEILRLNAALRLRGYTTRDPRAVVDADTLAALREFQRDTGHPVQESELVERRWIFILGVASDESIHPHDVTLPASHRRLANPRAPR